MEIEFIIDPDTDDFHIAGHGVEPWEVIDVLQRGALDYPGREGTRVAIGQTRNGRYLKVIYLRQGQKRRIITAYDLPPKGKRALRKQRRKRP